MDGEINKLEINISRKNCGINTDVFTFILVLLHSSLHSSSTMRLYRNASFMHIYTVLGFRKGILTLMKQHVEYITGADTGFRKG